MAFLDKYLEAMQKRGGNALVFRSGGLVDLIVGGASKPMSSRPITAPQVTNLIQDALGAGWSPGASGTFAYASPGGPIALEVGETGEGPVVVVRPAAAAGPTLAELGGASGPPLGQVPAPPRPPAEAPPAEVTPPPEPVTPPPVAVRPPPAPPPAPPPRAPVPAPAPSLSAATGAAPSAGAPRHIEELFDQMLKLKASDLHLKSDFVPTLRVDGSVTPMPGRGPLAGRDLEILVDAIMPERNRTEFREANDTDFAYEFVGRARLRANVFRDIAGVGAVFRQIPSKVLTAQELKLPKAVLDLCTLHKGLVVVTGPTGSGKSTTLAAMIDWINKNRSDHIITIEDPVEFVHKDQKCLINQREVGTQTRSFKAALRAALREDPDIVLVGEMRDLETVAIAIETAETGHLVFGTLHTNTAPSTVDRLIDQFPTDRQEQIRVMLSESLKGVVAQTLLKKKGGGRVAALEILVVNHAIGNLIREGKTFQIPSLMQTGKALGMQTLNDALLELVKNNTVDPKEAFERCPNKKEFGSLLARAGYSGNWTAEAEK